MNCAVCIKQVPDTTDVRIDPETGTLQRSGVPSILNPFDEFAIEEGLRIREQFGGEVTVITMGPPQAEEVLRQALGMGANRVILLSDKAFAGSDTLATSRVLAAAIKKLDGIDLVICGKQAIDGDTAQVGPGIARRLGFSQLTYVAKVIKTNPGEGWIRVERLLEDGHEIVQAKLPALITVMKDINTPRMPSILKLRKAKNAEIPVWGIEDIGVNPDEVGLNGSPTWVHKIFSPEERSGEGEMISGEPEEAAVEMVKRIIEITIG